MPTTTYAIRNIRKSIIATLATVFGSAGLFTTPFTIYYDSALDSETVPSRPGIFIINASKLIQIKQLPVIAVMPHVKRITGELGNKWYYCNLELNVLGRTLDEVDDIAGAIMTNVDSFLMYQHSTGTATYQGGTGIDDEWASQYVPIGTQLGREGTFDHWISLACGFPVTYF